jgi:hypothetical protein
MVFESSPALGDHTVDPLAWLVALAFNQDSRWLLSCLVGDLDICAQLVLGSQCHEKLDQLQLFLADLDQRRRPPHPNKEPKAQPMFSGLGHFQRIDDICTANRGRVTAASPADTAASHNKIAASYCATAASSISIAAPLHTVAPHSMIPAHLKRSSFPFSGVSASRDPRLPGSLSEIQ